MGTEAAWKEGSLSEDNQFLIFSRKWELPFIHTNIDHWSNSFLEKVAWLITQLVSPLFVKISGRQLIFFQIIWEREVDSCLLGW